MRYCRFFLALVLPVAIALPARAGIIFNRHAKHNPAERVPQLISVVKTDLDENKREDAAKELRDYDSKKYPEIVSVLIDTLQHDAKAGVRIEALQSLNKIRPVSQEAGLAMEEATKDSTLRVRWQARSALLSYRIAGYRSEPTVKEQPSVTTNRPALAPTRLMPATQTTRKPVPAVPQTTSVLANGETVPPPLAATTTPGIRPLPLGSPEPVLTPASVPQLKRPQPIPDQGPDLPSK